VGSILDCRSASRLISRELDGPLPWDRRILLRFHLFWCGPCRRFLRQVVLVRSAIRRQRS